jgi:hypothetical protein
MSSSLFYPYLFFSFSSMFSPLSNVITSSKLSGKVIRVHLQRGGNDNGKVLFSSLSFVSFCFLLFPMLFDLSLRNQLVAGSTGGEVMIWDQRMGSEPLAKFAAFTKGATLDSLAVHDSAPLIAA